MDLGIAEEAYADAKDYIRTKNRAWTENPYDEHRLEPFIIQSFGELTVELHAAQLLQRRAAETIDRLRADPTRDKLVDARLARRRRAHRHGQRRGAHLRPALRAHGGARGHARWNTISIGTGGTARIHTLHDPFRWKLFHIGNYHLNGELPGPGAYF